MPKFISKRTFKLDFLGKEWKDCYIIFSSITMKENSELVRAKLAEKNPEEIDKISQKFLADHFIEGVGFDSETNAVIPIRKQDFVELPSEITEKAIFFLVGGATQ